MTNNSSDFHQTNLLRDLAVDQKPSLTSLIVLSFDNIWNTFYAIFIVLWCTLAVESWKRKQNLISEKWLMRNFSDPTLERSKFNASFDVHHSTQQIYKRPYINTYVRMVFISLPVTLVFIAAVVLCVTFTRIWYDDYYKNVDTAKIPYLASFIPSTANSIYIMVFSAIYKPVANWLVTYENH